jgi:hypothetical protein
VNTLSRTITCRFFASEDGYRTLERHWRRMVNSAEPPRLLAEHYLLYQVARGRDYRRAFALPTNPVKLANGQVAGCGLRAALQRIQDAARSPEGPRAAELLAPFAGTLTPQSLAAVALVLPCGEYGYVRTLDLVAGYVEPEASLVA